MLIMSKYCLFSFQNVEEPVLPVLSVLPEYIVPVDSNILPQDNKEGEEMARQRFQRAIDIGGGNMRRTHQAGPNYSLKRVRHNAAKKKGEETKPESFAESAGRG